MQIISISENSSLLNAVISLADENSPTLGFLPKEAFFKHASERKLLVSVDENDSVHGYLLYGTNQKDSLVYITHLCVDRTYRGKGVAKALLEELVKQMRYRFRGIRVRCRREYEATTIWPKLGFNVIGEMPGRSKSGSTLTVWWFDFGHPTLFSYAVEQRSQSKLAVVIDANIFYDLIEPPAVNNQLSHSLLSDWLDIEICLTSEMKTEINRSSDPNRRKRAWSCVDEFVVVESASDATQNISSQLRYLFPARMSDNDESDLRQLAKAAAANIKFFITNDEKLLKKSDDVYEKFGMSILQVADLIVHQDELMRETEYQPAQLAGSFIQRKRVSAEQVNLIEDLFQHSQSEKRSEFRQQIHRFLADPYTFEVNVVQNGEQPLALIAYSRPDKSTIEIPILRLTSDAIASILAIHLVHNAVLTCAREGRVLTRFTEAYLSDAIRNALRENDFAYTNGSWVKISLPIVENSESLSARLYSIEQDFPTESTYLHQVLDLMQPSVQDDNKQALLQAEKALWPIKIVDLEIPAYIVSIRPEWAMDLFDPSLANQTLFGADPFLMMNVENVYYRSSEMKLSAPARILWYISKGNDKFQGAMAIRACSHLDEVIIDKPKALFSRFKRLGVYTWRNVFDTAKQNVDKNIMAFRFSRTELFHDPVHRSDLQELWAQTRGRKFNILGPISISKDEFLRIYRIGMKV